MDALFHPEGLFARLRSVRRAEWESYVRHPFVRGIGSGTLPVESFRHYLLQDYLFLVHYARAWAFVCAKAGTLDDMRFAQGCVHAILDVEMDLHTEYCAGWGLTRDAIAAVDEANATLAYTRFVLDAGLQGDVLDLAVALAPCALGYAEIAERLDADAATRRDGNPYAPWIAMYSGKEFRAVARGTADFVDRLWETRANRGRFDSLSTLFGRACRLEAAFWQMGLECAP